MKLCFRRLRVRYQTTLNEIQRNKSNRDHKRLCGRPKSNGTINANKEIFLLIHAQRENDQSYNVKHPKYHMKDERPKTYVCWLKSYRKKAQKPPFHKSVKRRYHLKIIPLVKRGRSRIHPKKSGSGISDVYNPKWQFYCHLLVLKDNFTTRPTETNLKISFSSRNTEEVRSLLKRDTRIETISRVSYSMAEMVQTIRQKRDVAPVTTEQEKTDKSEKELFGEMMTKMIAGIPESEEKYLLKLRIQEDIVKTRYSFNRRYQGMSLSLNQQTSFFTSLGGISSRGSPLMSPSNLSEYQQPFQFQK